MTTSFYVQNIILYLFGCLTLEYQLVASIGTKGWLPDLLVPGARPILKYVDFSLGYVVPVVPIGNHGLVLFPNQY